MMTPFTVLLAGISLLGMLSRLIFAIVAIPSGTACKNLGFGSKITFENLLFDRFSEYKFVIIFGFDF